MRGQATGAPRAPPAPPTHKAVLVPLRCNNDMAIWRLHESPARPLIAPWWLVSLRLSHSPTSLLHEETGWVRISHICGPDHKNVQGPQALWFIPLVVLQQKLFCIVSYVDDMMYVVLVEWTALSVLCVAAAQADSKRDRLLA